MVLIIFDKASQRLLFLTDLSRLGFVLMWFSAKVAARAFASQTNFSKMLAETLFATMMQ